MRGKSKKSLKRHVTEGSEQLKEEYQEQREAARSSESKPVRVSREGSDKEPRSQRVMDRYEEGKKRVKSNRSYTREQIDEAVRIAQESGSFEDAEDYLQNIRNLTFGVESVTYGDNELEYINLGDTYDYTVCRENGKFFGGDWGSWYEAAEQEYEEENGTIHCGFSGEPRQPVNDTDWSK